MAKSAKPKLAVWKFASCDGCQLTLLDCEDELLEIAGQIDIANFPEASSAVVKGPYDLSLVEGSITTEHDEKRIHEVRKASRFLVTIGACATSGGIQALRNFKNVKDFVSLVYARPQFISTLKNSTAIADHVNVDFELRGCPVSKPQLLEVITSFLAGKKPIIPTYSVCMECKRKGIVCVMVSQGRICLGPVTQAGCDALCPTCNRGCFSCFGPKETAHSASLAKKFAQLGAGKDEIVRIFRGFNGNADVFRKESEYYEE